MSIELAIVTGEVLSLIAEDPLIEQAKDGRRLLVRGLHVSSTWPTPTPAEQTAWSEGLPVIELSPRQALDVAMGGTVDTRTRQGEAARVRLATRIELMVANRQARTKLLADCPSLGLPEPLGADRAAVLTAPIEMTPDLRRRLLAKFEPSAG